MGKKTDPTDDTNYFSSLKYGRDEGVGQDVYVDVSDAYANYKQYVLSFLHVPSNTTVYFKAYVTEYNESFNCQWNPTEVYGRTDPIQTYKGTKRAVSLAFDVPAASMGEAYENLGRISKLVQMLYPTYIPNEIGNGNIIGQAPLIRVKMMNLITKERRTITFEEAMYGGTSGGGASLADINGGQTGATGLFEEISAADRLREYKTSPDPSNGVLAAISSISYRSDLQKIQMFEKATNTVLPQSLTVNLSFDVIHEQTNGWTPGGKFMDESFPHKIMLHTPESAVGDDQSPRDISERISEERDNQARQDQKQAAKNRLFERMAINALGRGLSNIGSGQMGPTMVSDDD